MTFPGFGIYFSERSIRSEKANIGRVWFASFVDWIRVQEIRILTGELCACVSKTDDILRSDEQSSET